MSEDKIARLERMHTELILKLENVITKFDTNKERVEKLEDEVSLNSERIHMMEIQVAKSDTEQGAMKDLLETLVSDLKESRKQFSNMLYSVVGGVIITVVTLVVTTMYNSGAGG